MAIIEDTKADRPGPLRMVGRVLSWVLGVLLILLGLTSVVSLQPGPLLIGVGLILAGGVVLPPVSTRIRQQAPLFQPVWAPPLAALGVGLVLGLAGTLVGVAPKPPPKPVVVAKTAAKPAPDPAEVERLRKATLAAYILELNTKVIPRIDALPTKLPAAMPNKFGDLDAELAAFGQAAKVLEGGQAFAYDPSARAAMQRLRTTLVAKQVVILPIMRLRFGGLSNHRYWYHYNMEVGAEGEGYRTLRLTGPRFHANQEIYSFRFLIADRSQRLRFAQVIYSRGRTGFSSAYTDYLASPSDDTVGYWSITDVFTEVPALKEPAATAPPATKARPKPKRSRPRRSAAG